MRFKHFRFAVIATFAALAVCASAEDIIGRPVNIVSLSFNSQPLDKVLTTIDAEGAKGAVDLLALPEMWNGSEPEPLDGPTITAVAELAKKHKMYIVHAFYRLDGDKVYNSSALIDREGKVVGVYDKAYVFWSEFPTEPRLVNGGVEPPVFETDFGKVACTICFDANFPELWKYLGEKGAELVIFSSAYSAGRTLEQHSLMNHYYIVSSTLQRDCIVTDITGTRILDEKKDDTSEINVSRVTLDLDKSIFHLDFHYEQREKLKSEFANDVIVDDTMSREGWFTVQAKRPGVSARLISKQLKMEELRDYIARSRRELNAMRGVEFAWNRDTASAPGQHVVAESDATETEIAQHYAKADAEVQEYIRWTAKTFGKAGYWYSHDAFAEMSTGARDNKITMITDVLKGEYGRHLCNALAEAGALKDPRLIPGLTRAASYHRDDSDYDCRAKWMAVAALGRQDDINAVPTLIPLVDHGNQNVRMWARASLARLTGQNFGDDKQAWGKWWNEQGHEAKLDLASLKPWTPPAK